MNLQILARKQGFSNSIEILSMFKIDGVPWCLRPLKVEDFEEARLGTMPESTFSIDATAAQVLMDDLWGCGIRPSEGASSAGAMLATQNHLKDMRRLVFSLMGLGEQVSIGGRVPCARLDKPGK